MPASLRRRLRNRHDTESGNEAVRLDATLMNAISTYGAWLVGGVVAVESMGIPVPGEPMLVSALASVSPNA